MLPVPEVLLSLPKGPQHPCRAHVHDRCSTSPVMSVLHREETAFQLAAGLRNVNDWQHLLSSGPVPASPRPGCLCAHATQPYLLDESQICRGRPPTPPVPVQTGAVLGRAGSSNAARQPRSRPHPDIVLPVSASSHGDPAALQNKAGRRTRSRRDHPRSRTPRRGAVLGARVAGPVRSTTSRASRHSQLSAAPS